MRALTLMLLAAFATLATGASVAEHYRQDVQVTPAAVEPEVINDKQGIALSVIGRFDLGLDKTSSRLPARVEEAVSKFILNDRRRFGLSAEDKIRLVVESVEPVDKDTAVARVHQYVGDVRVIDSDLSAAFAEDGALLSLNGRIVPNRSPQARATLTQDRVLSILAADAKSKAMGDLSAFQDAGRNRWSRKDGAMIEAGWSRRYGSVVWRAWLPEEILWIDDKSGAIVRRESQRDSGPTRDCRVRHRDWPRAADGRATSLAESSSSTKISPTMKCEADEWFGTCYWHLKRQPFGFPHPIDRVQDENGGEVERTFACSSSSTPVFNGSGADALREHGAFYVAHEMRYFIKQNVWDQVSPNRDGNLDVHLDDSGVLDDGNPSAYFNGFWVTIRAHQNRAQQHVLMHEYGHYVVWSYDDVSGNCEQGTDEGDAIDETLANLFAGLFALDSSINPRYGAYSGLVGAPRPHTDAESMRMHDVNCSAGDPHNQAQAFEQAVWELLFNVNATVDNCTNSTGHGNRIWVGASREAVIRHVGAALGYSLKVLGQNITHQQIAAQMILKIRLDSGSATANRAKSVFVHHGVL